MHHPVPFYDLAALQQAEAEDNTAAAAAAGAAPATGLPVKRRRAPLTIRSIAELRTLPDPACDLILSNGYIERGEPTSICGMGGIGKSRLIMQLAMMHRAGLPFLTWDTYSPELRWLFLQTENGNRRLKSDIAAMLTAFTPEQQAAIESGIFLHTVEGEDDGYLLLTDPDNIARAVEAIQKAAADIVVWDPLRDCTSDDLNKDSAMNEALRHIRSITRHGDPRRACLVIHHANEGKASIAKAIGYDRGAFGKNSKTLKTWARAQFNVAPATPDDNSQILIASGKCNNFEEFSPLCARLNPDTMLYDVVEGFDFAVWQESLSGESEKPKTEHLCSVLREAGGGLDKMETIARLGALGIGKNAARSLIAQTVAAGDMEETSYQRDGKRSGILLTLVH